MMTTDTSLYKAFLLDVKKKAYAETLALQESCVAWRLQEKSRPEIFIMVEHNPVFTLGKNGGRGSLMVPESLLAEKGVEIFQTGRGGDITWHGPGQLVIYPIVNLRVLRLGVAEYVDLLEEFMIALSGRFGVSCNRDKRNHGVWVGDNKLGSIGIRVRHGVTFHGLAFNVNPDFEHFSWINPCGLQQVGVTSLLREGANAGKNINMDDVKILAIELLSKMFYCHFRTIESSEIDMSLCS